MEAGDALAEKSGSGVSGGTSLDLLRFSLEGRRFAVRLESVIEVLRAAAPTGLPEAPEAVSGLLNIRGEIVPVLDVRRRFGFMARPMDLEDHLVVVWAGERRVALWVDRAEGLLSIPRESVVSLEAVARVGDRINGIGRLPDGLVLIHNPERFLNAAEEEAVEVALAEASSSQEEP